MTAVLLGSISTLADTSELQREAFNDAFRHHDLDWTWGQEQYREMLTDSGGADRVAAYAEQQGDDVDADAVHATKSARFQELLAERDVVARPGVVATVRQAREAGAQVALVTTTSRDNVDALLAALDGELDAADLALVLDASSVADGKPDPAVYLLALERLGEDADGCVAVEDNLGGVQAATAAGIHCVAFPNANTATHDLSAADEVVDQLDPAAVLAATERSQRG